MDDSNFWVGNAEAPDTYALIGLLGSGGEGRGLARRPATVRWGPVPRAVGDRVPGDALSDRGRVGWHGREVSEAG